MSVEDGRIVLTSATGQKTVLTESGRDSDPWISPDGGIVLFIRHASDDVFKTGVYRVELPARTVTLLYEGPAKYAGREMSYFGEPQLDGSGKTLYLLAKEGATWGSLVAIRLASGAATLTSDHVVGFDVVVCPAYRGDLLALKRFDSNLLGQPYFLYWLYSASGADLGMAGVWSWTARHCSTKTAPFRIMRKRRRLVQ